MKQSAEDIPADLATLVRIGTVIEIDLVEARCRVRFGDPDEESDDGETPPIRWVTPRAGRTRIWSPPSIGEQVVLLSPDGQIGAAVAICGVVQDTFPPVGNSLAELIEWEDGAQIRYDPQSHELEAQLPAGSTVRIIADEIRLEGNVTITGTLDVEDDVAVQGQINSTGDVIADDVSLMDHTHTGVSSGSSTSGPPA